MIRCLTFALLLAALAVGTAGAADIGVIDIADFSGGLNTRDGAGGIADNELAEILNCHLNGKAVMKRNGFVSYADSAQVDSTEAGTGIAEATFTDSTRIVVFAGQNVAWDSLGSLSDITGAVSLTNDKPVLTAMVNNNLVAVNGTNPAAYWDGSGVFETLSGTNIPTAPDVCAEYKGRLFLAQGRYLYWSEYSGAWKTFHPDDYQPFEEDITGLYVYGYGSNAKLIVFTRRGVTACIFDASIGEAIGGRGVFRFEVITMKHGCISPYSVQECQSDDGTTVLMWADSDGIKALSGNSIVRLTDRIQPTWDALDKGLLATARGVHYTSRRWYMLTCGEEGETENNRVIVYDLRNWTVGGIFDWDISTLDVVRVNGADKIVGSDYDGYWHTYDSGTSDGGSNIESYFLTKSYDGGSPLVDKGFMSVVIHHSYQGAYRMDFTVFLEASTSSNSVTYTARAQGVPLGLFMLGTDRLYSKGGMVIAGNELRGRGRNAQVRVAGRYANEPFEVYRLQLPYEPGRMVIAR